ncbi:hypothetical protein OA324_01895 [Prochlorococcus sp. AH-716-O05]|nr:hypothetical protein [Prochlorococcus sp. AH-716-O05]
MSNQSNSFLSPLSDEMVKNIDQLNLPIIKKHHVRLLAHCLEIFKEIGQDEQSLFEEDELLKEWCEKQSRKFNDKNFNQLFYEQMSSAAKKLNYFSNSIEKNFKELDLDDLITLVQQNQEN